MDSKKSQNKYIKALYEEELQLKDGQGKQVRIGPEGSLGLLAIGYKGIIAMRRARMEQKKKQDR